MKGSLYIKITAMLACIALLGVGITAFTAPRPTVPDADPPTAPSSDKVCVVTSFYPVYIAALNVVGDTKGVQVVNMVNSQFGCLHDYQMSPQDRATLQSADVFVMNGAGAEPFLEALSATETVPNVIDLSVRQTLLESGHVHEHGEEPHEHEHDEAAAVNDHLWVSPRRYRLQIETLRDGLMAADPAHAADYERHAASYIERINATWERMQAAAEPLLQTKAVLFHDSLAYLAEDLGLTVAAALNVGEDSGVSAEVIKQAESALRGEKTALFFYDSQYTSVGYTYLQEIPQNAVVLTADTCVSGDGAADSWLVAMTALCEALEAVSIE